MRAFNQDRGTWLADEVSVAESFFARLKGLIGTVRLAEGSALLIRPCDSVHTCFMRYPIDVVFLDSSSRVLHSADSILPYRLGPRVRGSKEVLELPAGTCSATKTVAGDKIKLI